MINAYAILIGKPERKRLRGDLVVEWKIILEWSSEKYDAGTGLIGPRISFC
jgi:hypothetical protein